MGKEAPTYIGLEPKIYCVIAAAALHSQIFFKSEHLQANERQWHTHVSRLSARRVKGTETTGFQLFDHYRLLSLVHGYVHHLSHHNSLWNITPFNDWRLFDSFCRSFEGHVGHVHPFP